jgi:hypothetical protein
LQAFALLLSIPRATRRKDVDVAQLEVLLLAARAIERGV